MKDKTLVLGASTKADRYAYKAANMLLSKGNKIALLGNKTGEVANHLIETDPSKISDIDTVTLYLNPKNQEQYYDFIKNLKPRRVIFNPGTENPEFEKELESEQIETIEACTLVMLSTGQY